MMKDGPPIPPIITMGVPFGQMVKMMVPCMLAGWFGAEGVLGLLDEGLTEWTVLWLVLSFGFFMLGNAIRDRYFAARRAAIDAVFAELERRYERSKP
jgi:hypothetical protein